MDDLLNISTEMWKVINQTIEQVWMAVNDVNRIKAILIQMQFSFIDNDNLSFREISQTLKEYYKQIIWETEQEHKTRLEFELSINSIEHSTLLHITLTHQNASSNPTYSNELNSKCKEVIELLPGILFGPSNTIISYESITIQSNLKEVFEFVSSWDFSKAPHSLIKESKCIDKQPNELNGIIQCMCRNGSIHFYQVAEVYYDPTHLIAKYNIKEIDSMNIYKEEVNNIKSRSINIDSYQINFIFGQADSNMCFLSVEHQFKYKNIELCFNPLPIATHIKDKKCMLIEIKKYLEDKFNRNKTK